MDNPTIKPLCFLKLELSGPFSGENRLEMEFVFGTGVEGLAAFERLLADKAQGDFLELDIPLAQAPEYFEHLFSRVPPALMGFDPLRLGVRVAQVRIASNREVVKAMAKNVACEGDCGCGCGGYGH